MVIRIDDPNAKDSDLRRHSLPSLSVRAGLPTPGFHDRAEWHVYKEVKVPMHEFQSFRQPLTAVMATFGVLPQERAVNSPTLGKFLPIAAIFPPLLAMLAVLPSIVLMLTRSLSVPCSVLQQHVPEPNLTHNAPPSGGSPKTTT